MTSRTPGRRAHAIPSLNLPRPAVSSSSPAVSLTRAAQSAPTPNSTGGAKPMCPKCGHRRAVFRWCYWSDHTEHIYACAMTANDTPTRVCGNLWLESYRSNMCTEAYCRATCRIQERGTDGEGQPAFAYWCNACHTWPTLLHDL